MKPIGKCSIQFECCKMFDFVFLFVCVCNNSIYLSYRNCLHSIMFISLIGYNLGFCYLQKTSIKKNRKRKMNETKEQNLLFIQYSYA